MITKITDRPIRKIAVFRALQLGDMLNVVPAIRALRHAFPSSEITLLGLPWSAAFAQRFGEYVDGWVHFPGFPGLPEQEYDPFALLSFMQYMREEKFDLLLQMQGNGTIVNELLSGCGAKLLAGFHNYASRVLSPFFIEYPEAGHEIRRHLALMEHLGIPSQGEHLEFPLTDGDQEEFSKLGLSLEPARYVCIHPGSRGGWRQWPPANFAVLGDLCAEKGMKVVVTGTIGERAITARVISHMHHPVIDLTGLTGLGAMGVLLRDAGLLISNCTGVSHMAAALQTPSLVISMDGEPYRWGPLNEKLHRTIDWTQDARLEPAIAAVGALFQEEAV